MMIVIKKKKKNDFVFKNFFGFFFEFMLRNYTICNKYFLNLKFILTGIF